MSEYFAKRLAGLRPYVAGEQPKDGRYIKLNTNENPYFPSRYAVDGIGRAELERLRLYSDPDCAELCAAIADRYGIGAGNVLPTNGSDEALAFCFAAFCENGVAFPDVTYGFYKVFAGLFGAEYTEIPLDGKFAVRADDYIGLGKTIVLANPNAQTGVYLPVEEVERIVSGNPNNVVVIDEAYIDFGGESAVGLTRKYKNLIVVQTFSKSRSLAGARVGFAIACEELIADMQRVKFSFNPYNVNSLSSALAAAAIADGAYFDECRSKIIRTREAFISQLRSIGYTVIPSAANFVLAKSPSIGGAELYERLKNAGILVRHFADARINDYVRITVGTNEDMAALTAAIKHLEDKHA